MAKPVRLRLLDPTTAWAAGGAEITVHGTGFSLQPQSMLVRLSLPLTSTEVCVDVRSGNEGTASFIVPSLTSYLKSRISSCTVTLEIKATGVVAANPQEMLLHPELSIKKISPTHLPFSATSYASIMLFLELRYSHSFVQIKPNVDGKVHLTAASPVYVRISYVSEHSKIPLSVVRPAMWSPASQVNGDMLIEFQPPKTSIGVMTAEVSLNKVEFFGALCYNVWRDFDLASVKPRAVLISPSHPVDVVLQGQHFLETGEVVVRLSQPPDDGVPQGMILNAVCKSATEISVSLPPKTHCGVTRWTVSCNRGEHFCLSTVECLLFRERVPHTLVPTGGALTGGTKLRLLLPSLDNDDLDSFQLLLTELQQTKVLRIRFAPVDDSVPAKTVWATPSAIDPLCIECTTPAFDVKHVPNDETFPVQVALSVDGRYFSGNLTFHYFAPYVIKALSLHHGPNTGGTRLCITMSRHVPVLLPILVKFTSVRANIRATVVGSVVPQDDDATVLQCHTPIWPIDKELQLTKVQVSLNDGVDYIPKDTDTSVVAQFQTTLDVDETYLLYLFYPPPTIHYIWPTSTSVMGGGLLRLKGENITDHGGTVSVVFRTGQGHRRVRAFQRLFCIAPPSVAGLVDVYVSLNGQQYSKCCFRNIPNRSQFLYYELPSITCVTPISSPSQVSSTVTIIGESIIDTGTIQVRFSYLKQTSIIGEPHTVRQYAAGRLNAQGHIECASPILRTIAPNLMSTVEISLNSCDFTGPKHPFSFYRRHTIKLVEPIGMALDLATLLKLHLTPKIITDGIKVRLKVSYVGHRGGALEKHMLGPMVATAWTTEHVEFLCPALSALVQSPQQLRQVDVEVALNNQHFLDVGNLLNFTVPYSVPKVDRIWPVAAPFESPTELHLFGSGFASEYPTHLRLSIPGMTPGSTVSRVLDTTFVSPEQVSVLCPPVAAFTPDHQVQLNWLSCNVLPTSPDVMSELPESPKSRTRFTHRSESRKLRRHPDNQSRRRVAIGGMKVLPISIEMATRFDQFSPVALPVAFYTAPSITHVAPRGGFTTGGAVVELHVDAAQLQYLHVVDIMPMMFGDTKVTGHRVDNTVSVVAPALPAGQHLLTIAFNQQCYEMVRVGMFPVYFEAFEPPVVHCLAANNCIMSFGPMDGGTPVSIRGQGFIESASPLVKFVFYNAPFATPRGPKSDEYIVEATIVDGGLIKCIAPPVTHAGIANVQISCNGQQFSEDSQLHFEYHAATKLMLEPGSAKCGALDGGTPIIFHVLQGLPEDRSSLDCMVQLVDINGHVVTVPASFVDDSAVLHPRIQLLSPPWPYPTKVQLRLSLNRQVFFFDTELSFLYFDAPDVIQAISPVAGPTHGKTRVLVACNSLLETGDIVFKLLLKPGTCADETETLELVVPGRVSKEDEALEFETPPVPFGCHVFLQMSLNGVDFCTANRDVYFAFYMPPTLTSFHPTWAPIDCETVLRLYGQHLRDYGAPIEVQLTPWRGATSYVVPGRITNDENGVPCVVCSTPTEIESGFVKLELSLNGQQFTVSEYPDPRVVSALAVHKTKPLYPFRFFAQPYFLTTSYGSAGGGSRVVFCGGPRLAKALAKCDAKCYVQFTPVKLWSLTGTASTSAKLPDSMTVAAEVDATTTTVTCRAPMCRQACIASVELLFNEQRALDAAALGSAREKYHFFDAPAITEVVPSCGPMAGDTVLLLLGTNIFESHQIHVRFQSAANRHEFCIVRGHVTTTLSNGTQAKHPMIQCVSPTIEVYDPSQMAPTPTAPVKAQRYVTMLAQAGPRAGLRRTRDVETRRRSMAPTQANNRLVVNRASLSNAELGCPYLDVMVDFSLNGGEQYLPRGVPYRFYTPLDLRNLVYGPHHVPAAMLDELVGLDAAPRSRRLVVRGFEAATLVESKCIGVRFESNATHDTYTQPCVAYADKGEVSCVIPEFATPGTYRLLFSLNSQQFTYLGDIRVHAAMKILTNTPLQSPLNGGNVVHLETEIPTSIGDLSIMPSSHRRIVRHSIQAFEAPEVRLHREGSNWREKVSHRVRVSIVAPVGTRKVSARAPVVTVRSRVAQWIMHEASVDMAVGMVDIDATSWPSEGVIVTVHLKASYNTYRVIVTEASVPTMATLTKLPSVLDTLYVVTPSDAPTAHGDVNNVHLVRHDALDAAPVALPLVTSDCDKVAQWRIEEGFFWLIARAPEVLVLAPNQTLLHCQQPIAPTAAPGALWVVGALISRPSEPLLIIYVNRRVLSLVATLPELASQPLHPLHDLYHEADAALNLPSTWALWSNSEPESMLPLQLSVCFKLAGTSAAATTPVLAVELLQDAPSSPGIAKYKVTCAQPPLSSKGKVLIWLGAHGICFSPPTSMLVYDASAWSIAALEPPCGLLGSCTPIKLRGTGFLETGAISVQFSTPTHTVHVPGEVWKRYFCNVTITGLTVTGRLTGVDTNGWYYLAVKCNDGLPRQTPAKRMLYQVRKEVGTLLWCEKMQFELVSGARTPQLELVLRMTADDTRGSSRLPRDVATFVVSPMVLKPGVSQSASVSLQSVDGSTAIKRSVDLSLMLEPPILESSMIVTQAPNIETMSVLDVQVSSGQCPYTPLGAPSFQVYELPRIDGLSPRYLPYSTGGEIVVHGRGFFNSGMLLLRVFFLSPRYDYQHDQGAALQAKLDTMDRPSLESQILPCTFKSATEILCTVPPRLKSRNILFCVSFDHHTFTETVPQAILYMFDLRAVQPSVGPTQGRTYLALEGANLNLCRLAGKEPVVRFSWFRGEKLLERAVYSAQLTSGKIYCYTPACKISLEQLRLELEVAVGGVDATFSSDAVAFTYYRAPLVKSMAPKLNLVPGCTDVYIQIVENWENSPFLNSSLTTCRFRIQGQAQTAVTSHNATGVIQCRLPRFTVPIAVPQLLQDASFDPRHEHKVWVRNSGLFVTLLRARNLRLPNTTTTTTTSPLLRPFVLFEFESQKLRSTLREFTSNPTFYEQFDFELQTTDDHCHGDLVLTVQNDVESGRHETLGILRLPFASLKKAIKLRAWFPLQLAAPPPRPMTPILAQNSIREYLREPPKELPHRGEVELFIHFQPMLLKRPSLRSPATSRLTSALKKTMHVETAFRSRKISAGTVAADAKTPKPSEADEGKKVALQRLLGRPASAHVTPTEMIVELALNGQDFMSVCATRYTIQPLPIIADILPKCLPSCGGSKLMLHGFNFVDTKCIRLAFLWGIEHYAELRQSFRHEAGVAVSVPVTVVTATFESANVLSCVTPPTKRGGKASFTVIVALNGVDFNSVFLAPPLHSVEPENDLSHQSTMALWSELLDTTSVIEASLPHHQWLIYETPTVHRIESASPLYTTKLLIHGEHFVPTDNGRAKFIHEPAQEGEAKHPDAIVNLRVLSTTLLECLTPDFPPGSMVRVCIAMNGLDFIPMPDVRLCVCNAPKLGTLVPAWAYSMGDHPLYIHGSNFSETNHIRVSFTLEDPSLSVTVSAECSADGVIKCLVPPLHHLVPNEDVSLVGATALVDVSLGRNSVLEFTNQPLLLNLFRDQPLLDDVSPTDGPMWGGVHMKLRGRFLVDTPSLRVRFTRLLFDEASNNWTVNFEAAYTTMVPATYVNEYELLVVTPSLKDEGPVAVQLTLNGIDFSPVHDQTWFVFWRNWKTRVQIIRQSMRHDGGAHAAWQRYMEWKRRPKLNVYSTNNAVSSLKIKAAHSPRPPTYSRRLENLPDIIRKVETLQTPSDGGSADDMYIPPNIIWPHPDVDSCQKPRRLLEMLKGLYRSHATQADIYSRLIFVFDNAAHLNAKYTDSVMTVPMAPTAGARQFPPIRRRARAGLDIAHLRSALCYNGLCEGLRWIFPQVHESELVELWVYLDPEKIGKVTLDAMCSRLQTDPRPPSPEPGPMHYDPHPIQSNVPVPEMREAAPETSSITPQPFLDVGPILDCLLPTSPRPSFATTEVVVWCDPKYAGPGSEIAKPDVNLIAQAQHLSQFPRAREVKFAPLTEEEAERELERQKPKPPPPALRPSPLHAKLERSSRAFSLRNSASRRQLETLTGILPDVRASSRHLLPHARRQTRLASLGRTNEKKHLKEVRSVYHGILSAKAPPDTTGAL
ncbi:hypothetical protein SPRG_13953 [Saprolegnia parasitica CBS 223.65]|uniref:C2 domain-containing protein n=1 Tax=Saprolegnia parasitica (strain CBS 223.65) TaxID=695850 RepID=A0A067BVZ7_SAPPC|nr:hypothetical protein SPRG_13953 [Saprolegnia parasitica CBS 223.65]KDO21025.1 hypothetical protein SPRG_13953 [Saprolegnia parasitica CBS 223.65]|eukprot:XP_012208277.1 hypothetical protein SPRG_13953 [Saprolegnia parasitica CBS 223.65]